MNKYRITQPVIVTTEVEADSYKEAREQYERLSMGWDKLGWPTIVDDSAQPLVEREFPDGFLLGEQV